MRNLSTIFFLVIYTLLGNGTLAIAHDFQVGDAIVLLAKKPVGVPLHRQPSPSYLQHVPSGTPGVIMNIDPDPHWVQLRLDSGEVAWVHSKYVRLGAPTTPPPQNQSQPHQPPFAIGGEEAVWSNQAGCETSLSQGHRMALPSKTTVRLGTWNVRWFPIGSAPDDQHGQGEATNLNWLTCTLIWMSLDVIAVQEILATSEATKALNSVIGTLSKKTGDTWKWYRQPCGRPEDHHIAILWNESRVALSNFESLWEFNAKADSPRKPCTYGLRPGQYVQVRSRVPKGADFHLIAVHLKSGPNVFALEERQKALNRIDRAVKPLLDSDQDVVILGDFNTMGAGDWHSQKSELKYVRRMVGKEKPGFDDLPLTPQCSHYFRGRGGWLDHVLVTKSMKEVNVSTAHVTGYCALSDCQRIKGNYPQAYRSLSDHCPVVVEIQNRDQD